MTYNIDNYHLLEKQNVAEYDTLDFFYRGRIITYQIRDRWLNPTNINGLGETAILKMLREDGLIDENDKDFCSYYYGYQAFQGNTFGWPDFHSKDFVAATKIAIGLFDIISGKTNPIKIVPITTLKKLEF